MLVVDWDSVEGVWVGIFIELLSLNVHSEDCTLVSFRSMRGNRNTHYYYGIPNHSGSRPNSLPMTGVGSSPPLNPMHRK